MKPLAIGHRLPRFLAKPLFGDRRRVGPVPPPHDPDWREWQRLYGTFYDLSQKQGIGKRINDAGYRVLRRIDLEGKQVLEIGPGDLSHFRNWRGRPASFAIADVAPDFLRRSERRLREWGVPCTSHLVPRDASRPLPFPDAQFDVVLSFYSLEHLYPLSRHLEQPLRVLKRGGLFAGAIPAEGGLAWGLGRFLTTRRWLRKHSTLDPDKIICWEHRSFADQILSALDEKFLRRHVRYWPWRLPCIDLNLVIQFVYEKR